MAGRQRRRPSRPTRAQHSQLSLRRGVPPIKPPRPAPSTRPPRTPRPTDGPPAPCRTPPTARTSRQTNATNVAAARRHLRPKEEGRRLEGPSGPVRQTQQRKIGTTKISKYLQNSIAFRGEERRAGVKSQKVRLVLRFCTREAPCRTPRSPNEPSCQTALADGTSQTVRRLVRATSLR